MNLIRCTPEYADAILAIYNDAIANSTALYEYKPRTPAVIAAWFEAKAKGNYPVIGLVTDEGELMGFASYGAFRAFPAYKYTVEHSVYVAAKFRGRGLGRRLLQEVVAAARSQKEAFELVLASAIGAGLERWRAAADAIREAGNAPS